MNEGTRIYTVDIEGGVSDVTSISILSHNDDERDYLSDAIVTVSGKQCGYKAFGTSAFWQKFQCYPGTSGTQIQVEGDFTGDKTLGMCGIKAYGSQPY